MELILQPFRSPLTVAGECFHFINRVIYRGLFLRILMHRAKMIYTLQLFQDYFFFICLCATGHINSSLPFLVTTSEVWERIFVWQSI